MPDLEQHFLSDAEALAWVVAQLDPRPGERAVELGAGRGTIAAALRPRVAAEDLTLVELDPRLAAGLRRRFPSARVAEGDWREVWAGLGRIDLLVVSLPNAWVSAALAAAAASPPRVVVAAVARERPPAVPEPFVVGARLSLPPESFSPPQPFAGEAWALRPRVTGQRPAASRSPVR